MTSPEALQAAPDLDAPGLPGEARLDHQDVPPAHLRAFSLTAFTMNRFIIDHMLRASRQFDGDFEAMILFGMVAHLNVAHLMPPGTAPSAALDAGGRVPDAQPRLRPVRLRDLTQISGRPRETVRRKLEWLLGQGRLLRVEAGYVLNVETVDAAMHALTVDGVRRFLEAARHIEAALVEAERVLAR
jgi:hypothetical protein